MLSWSILEFLDSSLKHLGRGSLSLRALLFLASTRYELALEDGGIESKELSQSIQAYEAPKRENRELI